MSSEALIRVFVVDDEPLARLNFKSHLRAHNAPMTLVGEAGDGDDAVHMLGRLQDAGTFPDVVVMDIGMPLLDGISTTATLLAMHPQARIMMLSTHEAEREIVDAFQAGAQSYCLKDCEPTVLLQAIAETAKGNAWIDPRIAAIFIRHRLMTPEVAPLQSQKLPTQPSSKDVGLTEREREILALLAQGKSNAEMAEVLVLSLNTIKTHLKNIFMKIDVTDRTTAALWAREQGIV